MIRAKIFTKTVIGFLVLLSSCVLAQSDETVFDFEIETASRTLALEPVQLEPAESAVTYSAVYDLGNSRVLAIEEFKERWSSEEETGGMAGYRDGYTLEFLQRRDGQPAEVLFSETNIYSFFDSGLLLGVYPLAFEVAPERWAVGIVTQDRAMYSGGGASLERLRLYSVEQPRVILMSTVVSGSALIRACFTEEDYNSGMACHDEYYGSSVLRFSDSSDGYFRLTKNFNAEMFPVVRPGTSEADREAVCSSYVQEFIYDATQERYVTPQPELEEQCAIAP
jgi:hypothetical protein